MREKLLRGAAASVTRVIILITSKVLHLVFKKKKGWVIVDG